MKIDKVALALVVMLSSLYGSQSSNLSPIISYLLDSSQEKSHSMYEEKVEIPSCDKNNAEVYFISKESDFSEINNPDKRIFCVKPGDYSLNGRRYLRTSGTADKKRYILLDNGNTTHPAKLDKSQLVKMGFVLENTQYWVIDRMSYWDSNTSLNPIIIDKSDHNIINRYFMDNVGNGIYIYPDSDYNTIENCRIQRDEFSLHFDRAAIGINSNSRYNEFEEVSATNNKILNNEVYNFVDGFQAIRSGWYDENNASRLVITRNVNYEGTIVDNNHFYIDSTIYTDCNGHHDVTGSCAYAENGMDLKAGSSNADNPMIITNNKMWGFRKSDTTNSSLSDPGAAMPVHFGVYNVVIKNNLVFDAVSGFSINSARSSTYAMADSLIEDNVFIDTEYAIYIAESNNVRILNNSFGNFSSRNLESWAAHYWFLAYDSSNFTLSNNLIFNTNNRQARINNIENAKFENNRYFDALRGDIPEGGGETLVTSPRAHSIVFTTDKLTNHPREIMVQSVDK